MGCGAVVGLAPASRDPDHSGTRPSGPPSSRERIDDGGATGPGRVGQAGVVGENGDWVPRVVQQRRGGQVDRVEGFQLPGQGAGPLNDVVADVEEFDSVHGGADKASIETFTMRRSRLAGRTLPSRTMRSYQDPSRWIGTIRAMGELIAFTTRGYR